VTPPIKQLMDKYFSSHILIVPKGTDCIYLINDKKTYFELFGKG